MTAEPILIIEDEHALGTALSFLVRRIGHLPTLVASGEAGLNALETSNFSAVVLDIGLPDMSGLDVLERLRKNGIAIPVLVITAHATLDYAILAQKSGATEYLTKPLDLRQFEQMLNAMVTPGLQPVDLGENHIETRSATLIGAAPCLRETFIGIARACAGNFPALIIGPSGSGKTLTAAVIHAHSPRANQRMEVLSCSGLKNADSFEQQSAGTLILDEVCELASDLQTRLASCLAGNSGTGPRLLVTTAFDPREAVRDGHLREDLYYALTTLTIPLPPLRERSGDIPALSAFFLGTRGTSNAPSLTLPVLAALQAYSWPGNVRELRHVLDYAVTMSGGGTVFLSHLPPHIAAADLSNASVGSAELEAVLARWLDAALALPESERPDYDSLLDSLETVMLHHLLVKHGNRPTHMAAALRMHRATLRQKLKRAGLRVDFS